MVQLALVLHVIVVEGATYTNSFNLSAIYEFSCLKLIQFMIYETHYELYFI